MAASTPLASNVDVESFINEYFAAWQGTNADRIMSYYSENVTIEMPGAHLEGKAAVREQVVLPFMTGFPGNRHVVRNMIFGQGVVVVEMSFEGEHKGPFAGRAATGAHMQLPVCSLYEYDLDKRHITAARFYFDVSTLLKQIGST
jgi:steroid delta-isomerase-like uncharacterized protein